MDYTKYLRLVDFAEFYYQGKTTKPQRNTVAMWCRDGWLKPYAKKFGNRWFIKKEVFDD